MATAALSTEDFLEHKSRFAVLLFIASEAIFFALLMAAYVYYTGSSPDGPNAKEVLDPVKTGMYTAFLLSSSITVWLAERAQRKENRKGLALWLIVTIAFGIIFLYGEMKEYFKLLHENVTVSRDLFGSTYYTLTGFHALHVVFGLSLLGVALSFALRGKDGPKQRIAIECISYYWHFVDAVWVGVFTIIYLWSTR